MKSKQQKQEEAKIRQEATAKLSPEERLEMLDRLGFRAVRERAKLQKKIENASKPKSEEAPAQKKDNAKQRRSKKEQRARAKRNPSEK